MKRNHCRSLLAVALVVFVGIAVSSCGGSDDSPAARGKTAFSDRALAGMGGNGRACVDCHMESENFQLTPAAAQARLAAMTVTGIDDPLFRAIDANDFRVNGAAARDFSNLTEHGLVRVTIPLPANVKLLDCGSTVPCPASARPTTETVADIWRATPSIFNVQITGPDVLLLHRREGPTPEAATSSTAASTPCRTRRSLRCAPMLRSRSTRPRSSWTTWRPFSARSSARRA